MSEITPKMVLSFLVVGVTTVLTYVGVMTLLHEYILLGVYTSSALGFIAGFLVSFLLNRNVTFGAGSNKYTVIKYFSVLASSMVVNQIIIFIVVESLELFYLVGPFVSIILLTPVNFVLNYKWVFNMEKMSNER